MFTRFLDALGRSIFGSHNTISLIFWLHLRRCREIDLRGTFQRYYMDDCYNASDLFPDFGRLLGVPIVIEQVIELLNNFDSILNIFHTHFSFSQYKP